MVFARRRVRAAGAPADVARVHLVHDHAAEGQLALAQRPPEEVGLGERLDLRHGDEQERRALGGEQRRDVGGPAGEAVVHALEPGRQVGEVAQKRHSRDPLDHREAEPPRPHPGAKQEAQRPPLHEPREPAGRLEEVERVSRRRRVEHDHVVVAARVQLVEPLHRHVLVCAGDRRGHLPVDPVLEDPLGRPLRRRLLADEPVERELGVEHRGVQGALDLVDVVAVLRKAQRAGEPAGRVDGEHEHAPAAGRRAASRGRPQRSSCRRRPPRRRRPPAAP